MGRDTDSNLKINASVKKQLRLFLKRLQTRGIIAEQVLLFGSYAHGTPNTYSDIDVCVVSRNFGNDYHQELVDLQGLSFGLERPMDVIPYHPRDLRNRYDTLAKEIHTYGIRVA